ncbi:hypothetical protein [Bacillus sp. Au-Bac7]|uniref:hypothetical protein n=1 Tax=Bacillus sp. Au-Bac7 TaxID=2906458 RepID=UPI001E618300|nr:hypothetical protein [Bacillus sp. Au-Bac7]MCE4051675.1 hypothetical protein [Bacillus sp. Au-Bac7]
MISFDAIEKKNTKKEKLSRADKKILKAINSINLVYPINGITEEGFVKTKLSIYESYIEIFELKKYDLFLVADTEEFDTVTGMAWNLEKLYPYPKKEVYMNFPEENSEQQEYFRYKLEKATSAAEIEALSNELEKLKHIEKNFKLREVYLFIFADNIPELNKRIELLERFRPVLGHKKTSVEKKTKILNKMNNQI